MFELTEQVKRDNSEELESSLKLCSQKEAEIQELQ